MKLYYSPGSCALASHIALEESRTDYEAIRIDFGSAQQKSSEFLEVNPKGRVPALVTERGILTETPAILFFLAQSFPGVKMAPLEDPFALAEAHPLTATFARQFTSPMRTADGVSVGLTRVFL